MRNNRETRNKRLKTILDFLERKRHPVGFSEVSTAIKKYMVSDRIIHHDLTLLEATGNIKRSTENGTQYSIPSPPILSKSDNDLAIEHSRKLLFSSKSIQGFDMLSEKSWLDELAKPRYYMPYLREHLEKGYYEEFWKPYMERQRLHSKVNPSQENVERLKALENKLNKELQVIMDAVNNGSPIREDCSICPHKEVRVKDIV